MEDPKYPSDRQSFEQDSSIHSFAHAVKSAKRKKRFGLFRANKVLKRCELLLEVCVMLRGWCV